jgi:hypothetical protein
VPAYLGHEQTLDEVDAVGAQRARVLHHHDRLRLDLSVRRKDRVVAGFPSYGPRDGANLLCSRVLQ